MNALRAILFLVLLGTGFDAAAQSLRTASGPVRVSEMIGGLDTPWALDFLPDGAVLVTERGGALLYVQDGAARRVAGVPKVHAEGQGGLLDVMVPRDFASSREVFLTFARKDAGGVGTALAVGRLDPDGDG